jgi:hypothetical protein
MTDLAESLDILKDFPPVPTKAWEASIHVDLKGEDYNKKLVWNSDGIALGPIQGSARTARALPRFEPKTINGLRLAAGARPAVC